MIVQSFVLTPVALLSLQKAKKDNAKKKEKEEKDRKAKERAVSILNFTQCALVTFSSRLCYQLFIFPLLNTVCTNPRSVIRCLR